MKRLFLFDMDGTLTAPREKMPIGIEMMLGKLQHNGFEVGIITGSDMNYVKQQCSTLFDMSLIQTCETHFLPCNGTKYILNGETVYSKNMKEYMGTENFRKLIKFLMEQQYKLCAAPPIPVTGKWEIPLTGHFFNYRESLLNWCPIGRNATQSDRKIWENLDKNSVIRNVILEKIQKFIETIDCDIEVKLGGDTSFDIFPFGWDKTYPLENTNHFEGYNEIYFIGDRCQPNGNDYELFRHPNVKGFETESPDMTIEIVNKILSQDV